MSKTVLFPDGTGGSVSRTFCGHAFIGLVAAPLHRWKPGDPVRRVRNTHVILECYREEGHEGDHRQTFAWSQP